MINISTVWHIFPFLIFDTINGSCGFWICPCVIFWDLEFYHSQPAFLAKAFVQQCNKLDGALSLFVLLFFFLFWSPCSPGPCVCPGSRRTWHTCGVAGPGTDRTEPFQTSFSWCWNISHNFTFISWSCLKKHRVQWIFMCGNKCIRNQTANIFIYQCCMLPGQHIITGKAESRILK